MSSTCAGPCPRGMRDVIVSLALLQDFVRPWCWNKANFPNKQLQLQRECEIALCRKMQGWTSDLAVLSRNVMEWGSILFTWKTWIKQDGSKPCMFTRHHHYITPPPITDHHHTSRCDCLCMEMRLVWQHFWDYFWGWMGCGNPCDRCNVWGDYLGSL